MQGARYNIINLSILFLLKLCLKHLIVKKTIGGGNFRPSHVDFLAFAR